MKDTMTGREKCYDCVCRMHNALGEFGGSLLSYKETLHDEGYWRTVSRLRVIMEQTEAMRSELTIIMQTLSDAKNG